MTADPQARAGVTAPSAWQIERVATALFRARDAVAATHADDDNMGAQLSELSLAAIGVRGIVERLLLAAAEAKASAEMVSRRIDDLRNREARFDRDEEVWREAAMDLIQAFPQDFPDGKFKSPLISASVKTGQPGVHISDETAIPDMYVRTIRQPDKASIRADMLQGVVIPGAELKNPQPHITIRTK